MSRSERHVRWPKVVWRGVSPTIRVLAFAAALVSIGLVLLAVTPGAAETPDRPWSLPFSALVIGFAIAESTALHVEIRKESHSLSLSAIPLMFGLLFLSPVLLALAYILGAAPAMLWIRGSDPIKTIWNSCLFVAEVALAALIVNVFLGDDLPETAIEWTVPLVAVLAAELMSLVAVPLVIMAVDTKFRPELFAAVGRSQVVAALAGTFTVTTVAATLSDPYIVFFAIVPLVGLGALLRSSGHLSQRFEDLQQLHSFTRALTNERGPRTLDTGLVRLVEIMRTRTAALLIGGTADDRVSVRAFVDDSFEEIDAVRFADRLLDIVGDRGAVHFTRADPEPDVQRVLSEMGASSIIAAPVLREVEKRGVLYVSDRLGMNSAFSADEIRLFESIADTLSARLANDHLVGQLELQAQHDSLTGLANRLSFEIALTSMLTREGQAGAVVMIDLDRFKEVNDSLGHETGDRLLVEIGDRLRHALRSTDMVARFGGDEFALLLSGRRDEPRSEVAARLAEVHNHVTAPVEFDGITFEIGASFGVAQWPAQGTDSASLLRRADVAMYEAKRNQLGVLWYEPELDAEGPRRNDLYLSCRTALETDQLSIELQPKVSLHDGQITGVEALARWVHPTYGPVSPAEFVPLITHAGLIGRLTRTVITQASEAAAMLRDVGHPMQVAVNLTPRDLLDPGLPDDFARIVQETGISPALIRLEITEDAMVVDFDASVLVLGRLRELGATLSIDDFGTGYSSLQHLHRLPVDQLKIDRSFVNRLADDESASAIVRASINLARDLGLSSVAEGIEDRTSLERLLGLGCDEAQGYYFSRPLPPSSLLRWIEEWSDDDRRKRLAEQPHNRPERTQRAIAAAKPHAAAEMAPLPVRPGHAVL